MTDKPFDALGYVKGLRRGFTTGTCAHAAAKAAAAMLVSGRIIPEITVKLDRGQEITLPTVDAEVKAGSAVCGIKKESGDDIDVTDGTLIFAEVCFTDENGTVTIEGGPGIGRVTKAGLPVPEGEWAINPTPRRMITGDLSALLPPGRGFRVVITAPGGAELAGKTWNPRLGIEGGISIIGTTGVVEPKSSAAFKASIESYIKVAAVQDKNCLHIVSGYVGEKYLRENHHIPRDRIIAVGDHVGHAIDTCIEAGVRRITLCGHIGKWSKLAAGLFNTDSRYGDARLETIAACAGAAGAAPETIRQILNLRLAEASVEILKEKHLTEAFDIMSRRIYDRCSIRAEKKMDFLIEILTLKGEVLGSFGAGQGGEGWARFTS